MHKGATGRQVRVRPDSGDICRAIHTSIGSPTPGRTDTCVCFQLFMDGKVRLYSAGVDLLTEKLPCACAYLPIDWCASTAGKYSLHDVPQVLDSMEVASATGDEAEDADAAAAVRKPCSVSY